jgi:hypothetical protein
MSWQPVFNKPAPLGYGAALTSATYIAAPLLAGFSFASIGLVATSQDKFRWPGASLLLLTIATILLVSSLQHGIICQKFFYSRDELNNWWTEEEFEERLDDFSDEQKSHFRAWRKYGWRALLSYNLGIAALGAALATLLVPLPKESGVLEATKNTSAVLMSIATLITFIYGVVTTYQVGNITQHPPNEESK